MSHAPKQRALEAYAAELLSPAATLRLERHLAGCDGCSQTLLQVRAYAQLRDEAMVSQPAQLTWERLEAALDAAVPPNAAAAEGSRHAGDGGAAAGPATPRRAAARPATPGKWIALAWPVLAVAATLVIGWIGLSGAPAPQPQSVAPTAAVSAPAVAAGVGRVTLVAGEVWLEREGARTPLALASEVPEGARVITGAGGVVHVVLGEGTGFALAPEGSVQLASFRAGSVDLTLERGSLANQVQKLTPDQHYEIGFGALSARVRGTRFVVEQQSQGTAFEARVSVHEGRVEVAQGDRVLALLEPGEAYASPPAQAPAAPASERAIHAVQAPSQQLFEAWATLALPPMAELRAWIIDGERIAPQGGLRMRLPGGRAELAFEDARGQLRTLVLDLRERDTQLSSAALAKLVAPKEARAGVLEPEQITQVIRAGVE
ncbi:MAG TPA: FecR domain-containing protein, partial [Polyangiales bacterium]